MRQSATHFNTRSSLCQNASSSSLYNLPIHNLLILFPSSNHIYRCNYALKLMIAWCVSVTGKCFLFLLFLTEEEVTYVTYHNAVSPDCLLILLFFYSGKREKSQKYFHFRRQNMSTLPTCEYCCNTLKKHTGH